MPNSDQTTKTETEAKAPDGGGFAALPCSAYWSMLAGFLCVACFCAAIVAVIREESPLGWIAAWGGWLTVWAQYMEEYFKPNSDSPTKKT